MRLDDEKKLIVAELMGQNSHRFVLETTCIVRTRVWVCKDRQRLHSRVPTIHIV